MNFFKTLLKPAAAIRDIIAGTLGAFGVHPNYLTLLAIPLAFLTAWFYWQGWLLAAGLMLIAVGLCDLVDGALARDFKRGTTFGAVLDTSVDVYTDMILLAGITLYFMRVGSLVMVLAGMAALAGTVMFAFVRARSEKYVERCKIGISERPERFIILIIASLAGQLFLAAVLIAVLTHVDTFRRLLHTNSLLKEGTKRETPKRNQE